MIDKRKETREKAVALRYDAERDAAPRVTAKGAGLLAQRIIEIAKQNGIYIHDDPDLVAVLSRLDVETQIPEPLYRAVAEVLAFVYRLNQQMEQPATSPQNKNKPPPLRRSIAESLQLKRRPRPATRRKTHGM
jgi:flagellar biosynthesis protein